MLLVFQIVLLICIVIGLLGVIGSEDDKERFILGGLCAFAMALMTGFLL